jgi:DUF971 family protein
MTNTTAKPTEIEKYKDGSIRIHWDDDHEGTYPPKYLRLLCPCAGCEDEWTGAPLINPDAIPDSIFPDHIEQVGWYAISIRWSDGHDTGIYSYEHLRLTCPCAACQAEREEKAK